MQDGGAAAILVQEEPKGAGKGTGLGLGAEPETVLRAGQVVWMVAGEASMVDGETQLHSVTRSAPSSEFSGRLVSLLELSG